MKVEKMDVPRRQEKGGTDAERLRVFDWFAERVLPRHREVGIGHAQLLRLLTTDARRAPQCLRLTETGYYI